MRIKEAINNRIEEIKALRLKLNENAELAFQEFKTQRILEETLKKEGIKSKHCAGTGLIALLNEGEEAIAVRADMDALPINGVSHLCGHDYHMGIALGTMMVLKDIGYDGCVKFLFQPAEEDQGGALPMIKEGALLEPKVTEAIGYHVWPGLEIGKIQVEAGPSMGSVDDFIITIRGVGGHAAMPHQCKNPIYPAMEIIQGVNIKSRSQVDPQNQHVITFTAINGGKATNVIPKDIVLMGTVRTFDEPLRYKLADMIKATAISAAENYGCIAEVDYVLGYPPVISEPKVTDRFIKVTKELLGEEKVLPIDKTFGADDFAFFALEVPSVHFRLGITGDIKGKHPLHSPYFDAEEDVLFYGIYTLVNYIINR
ncbi:MAG: M20 family metallopeptidase [Clostridiaceae bacterium]